LEEKRVKSQKLFKGQCSMRKCGGFAIIVWFFKVIFVMIALFLKTLENSFIETQKVVWICAILTKKVLK